MQIGQWLACSPLLGRLVVSEDLILSAGCKVSEAWLLLQLLFLKAIFRFFCLSGERREIILIILIGFHFSFCHFYQKGHKSHSFRGSCNQNNNNNDNNNNKQRQLQSEISLSGFQVDLTWLSQSGSRFWGFGPRASLAKQTHMPPQIQIQIQVRMQAYRYRFIDTKIQTAAGGNLAGWGHALQSPLGNKYPLVKRVAWL